MKIFRLFSTLCVGLFHSTHGCLTPDADSILVLDAVTTQMTVYQGMLDYAQTTLNAPLGIFNYTAPKQVRAWLGVMSSSYTSMAWHQKDSLDFLSRSIISNNYRRCDPNTAADQTLINNHAKDSFAYTYLWAIQEFVPEWTTIASDYATSLGLDLTKCAVENEFGCGLDTPYGLARYINKQFRLYFKFDGWNQDGSMSVSQYSWQFQEHRSQYESPSDKCSLRWKPANALCEVFDIGYLENVCWTPQEFQFFDVIYEEKYLMQHMASSGRSYFLGDEYICDTKTQYPCYDFSDEETAVKQRVSSNGDDEKAEIEFFDNVFGWFTEINDQYWQSSTLTQFEIITGITASIAAMYEATLLVWKDKLRHGVIRPRTIFNSGIMSQANQWKPYVMDNPTAEYPSHVSCMCTAYTRAMRKFANEVGAINPAISITLAAGSSIIEENKPANDVTMTFDTWGDILELCNDSRLNSGNHFSKSASEAEQLCGPVGPTVVEMVNEIAAGTTPSYTIDYNLPIYHTRCNPLLGFGSREKWSDPNGDLAAALQELGTTAKSSKEANNNKSEEKNIIEKAAQEAMKTAEDIKKAAKEQAQKLKEMGKFGSDQVENVVDGTIDTVTSTLDGAVNTVTSTLDGAVNGAVDMANEVTDKMNDAVSKVTGLFGGFKMRKRLRSRRPRRGN